MLTCGIIDEHPIICLGLQIFLRQHFNEMNFHSLKKIEDFPKLPDHQTIDMIIIGLDDDNKLKCLKLIELCKYKYPQAIIIAHCEILVIETMIQLLKLGVKGFVFKQNDPNQLVDCINKIKKGHIYLSPELENILHNKIITKINSNLSCQYQTGLNSLTPRQYLLATYLVKGIKTSEIAKHLKVTNSTISATKATILRKMNVNNVIELRTVLRHGHQIKRNNMPKVSR